MTPPRPHPDLKRPAEGALPDPLAGLGFEAECRRFAFHRHYRAQRFLGAHVCKVGDAVGVRFAVWAPRARRVSVVGEFNHWDGRGHPMCLNSSGVWQLFVPGLAPGVAYQFEVEASNGAIFWKTDPCGRRFKVRPDRSALVEPAAAFPWQDEAWRAARRSDDWRHAPISIYEVHLGSWLRGPADGVLGYAEIAPRLVAHAKALGFTHVELLPVTEHPYDESWGYQATGYFAPTSRFGAPDDFRAFVDHCHRNGIGVILDWVPAHFPDDQHGLARFDGFIQYEHPDPDRREVTEWNTLGFDLGRQEVRNFLISSALFWLEAFHVDGLRVDAVASLIQLEQPGPYGQRTSGHDPRNENIEGVAFLRELTAAVHREVPGALVMAEDSSSRPGVTSPRSHGGLGFDLKWNMGWMNDTLCYVRHPPGERSACLDKLVFSLSYAFDERFLLPLSHDEVVHGKRSLRHQMPGDDWQRFANLRLLYLYQFTHPGKKLLFMGDEFGQGDEWNSQGALAWHLREQPLPAGLERLVRDLNALYRGEPALHASDFERSGFEWIDCDDARNSVLVFTRRKGNDVLVVALNFTPDPHFDYRIGLPAGGRYAQLFNSDACDYGGSGISNGGFALHAERQPSMNRQHSLAIALPPLGGCVLKRVSPTAHQAEPSEIRSWHPVSSLPATTPIREVAQGGAKMRARLAPSAPPLSECSQARFEHGEETTS